MKIKLLRIASTIRAVSGVLMVHENPLCITLENPWLDNKRNISCIPHGMYEIERIQSPKYGETFHLLNVLGRSGILFHKGNDASDTSGCILLGSEFSEVAKEPFILCSKRAMDKFLTTMQGVDKATLDIHWRD